MLVSGRVILKYIYLIQEPHIYLLHVQLWFDLENIVIKTTFTMEDYIECCNTKHPF